MGKGKRGLLRIEAEAVTAVQAFQVVEIGLVELGSQRSASFTAGNASSQAAEHSTGDASDSIACRPKCHADGRTNPSTTGRHRKPTGSAGSRANSPTDIAAILQGDDPDRAAGRTLNDHESYMRWGQEGHSFLASWR